MVISKTANAIINYYYKYLFFRSFHRRRKKRSVNDNIGEINNFIDVPSFVIINHH